MCQSDRHIKKTNIVQTMEKEKKEKKVDQNGTVYLENKNREDLSQIIEINEENENRDNFEDLEAPTYRDSKVYEIAPSSSGEVVLLRSLSENPELDFWTPPRLSLTGETDVMVLPDFQDQFQKVLEENNISYKIIIADVEEVIEREKFYQMSTPYLTEGKFNFAKYHRYSEIEHYLECLERQYPKWVYLHRYGKSFEQRNLTSLHISTAEGCRKPIIFVDAGIHAREWIAPMFALYLIHQLAENEKNRHLIQEVHWVIVPLINPDGYEFTHTDNRLWRKTRSKGIKCIGVDGNRNFDFNWMGFGASNNECSPIYAGPLPFSEPETHYLSNLINNNKEQIKLYITLHSAAQCLLYPWGYTTEKLEDAEELHNLGVKVLDAIYDVNKRPYRLGSSAEILRPSAGSSRDWAKGFCGIKFCYTLELPGGGRSGFDLPADNILEVVEEVFEGIKVFHEHVVNNCSKKTCNLEDCCET